MYRANVAPYLDLLKLGEEKAWYTLLAHVCSFPQLLGKILYSRTPPCYDYV